MSAGRLVQPFAWSRTITSTRSVLAQLCLLMSQKFPGRRPNLWGHLFHSWTVSSSWKCSLPWAWSLGLVSWRFVPVIVSLLDNIFDKSLPRKHNPTEPEGRTHETPHKFIPASSCSSPNPVYGMLGIGIYFWRFSNICFKISRSYS